jgi:hypothetical protein
MDFEKSVHIGELYDLKHRKDKELYNANGYKDNLLTNNLSKVLYKNDKTAGFLTYLQDMIGHMFSTNVVLRNYFNWTVPIYYDRHHN